MRQDMENISTTTENITITTTLESMAFNTTPEKSDALSAHLFDILYKLFFSGILPVTIATGLFGNILTFVVFCRVNQWTATTVNLFSLTLSDFLNLCCNSIVVVQQNLVIYLPRIGNLISAYLIPHYQTWLTKVFSRYSMIFTVIIAVERVIAVLFPLHARRIWTKKFSIVVILITFTLVLAWFIPHAFIMETVVVYNNVTGELQKAFIRQTDFGKNLNFWQPYRNIETIGLQIAPVFLTACLNTVIIIQMFISRRRRMKLTSVSAGRKKEENSKEMRATRTVLSINIAFTVCLMPSSVIQLMVIADPDSEYHSFSSNLLRILYVFAFEMYMMNSAINFIIYILTSKLYRRQYKQLLRDMFCLKIQRNSTDDSTITQETTET